MSRRQHVAFHLGAFIVWSAGCVGYVLLCGGDVGVCIGLILGWPGGLSSAYFAARLTGGKK